jgi:phosphoribosylformylglycinamidine (FGAM) synthase-like amidotransferase family enzyme
MNTLILSGFGTNCERETAYACGRAGAAAGSVHTRHISEIYTGALRLEDYGLLVLIGGFLDGDDLGGARACANRFRYRRLPAGGTFLERLHGFVGEGRPVLGICNGFQLLVKLGLLPGEGNGGQSVTITTNARGRFEDRWVRLRVEPGSACVFTRGMESIELPVRHGEGRVIGASDAVLEALVERKLVPLRYALPDGTPTEHYPENPNGSPYGIAALCSPSGTVLGLMPHPEAFNHVTNHPQWTRRALSSPGSAGEDGDGLQIFRNAYAYLRG